MDERREIRVTLTEREHRALFRTVTGELEAATEADWESGVLDDLDSAQGALNRAWKRHQRRKAKPAMLTVEACSRFLRGGENGQP